MKIKQIKITPQKTIKQIKLPHTKEESCPTSVSIQIDCDNFDL